jgi:hypothetical protein
MRVTGTAAEGYNAVRLDRCANVEDQRQQYGHGRDPEHEAGPAQ